jgi:SAM-dependent methyltransferase
VSDLQELQSRLGFSGGEGAVRGYQRRYVAVFGTGARVLDLGCGPGVFLDLLREAGRRGVGLERSPAEAARARARGHEVIEQDALSYLAGQREAFDGAFCAHVIEHLAAPEAVELLRGLHRALRPGGRLVLVTPDVRDLEVLTERFWLDLTHVRPYPIPLLVGLLGQLGFQVVRAGNDEHSGRGSSWRGLLRRLWRALRFGPYGERGDAYVIAERP